jgi:hypothetical protein
MPIDGSELSSYYWILVCPKLLLNAEMMAPAAFCADADQPALAIDLQGVGSGRHLETGGVANYAEAKTYSGLHATKGHVNLETSQPCKVKSLLFEKTYNHLVNAVVC